MLPSPFRRTFSKVRNRTFLTSASDDGCCRNEEPRSTCHPLARHLLERAVGPDLGDRREALRSAVSMAILVHPLDTNLCLIDDEFGAITRDVSSSGLAFVHANPLDYRFLRVRLPNQERSMTVEVTYCAPAGGLGLLYRIGTRISIPSNRDKTGRSLD